MQYQLHNIRSVNGEPHLQLIDEGFIPLRGSWTDYSAWLQARIVELRKENDYQQIAVWTTIPASEGAIVAIELPDDKQRGKLHVLVKGLFDQEDPRKGD